MLSLFGLVGFRFCSGFLRLAGVFGRGCCRIGFVPEILDALWDSVFIAELPFCFCTGEPRAFVVLFVVSVPGVAVFEWELAVPLPVGRLVDAVDVDVTALADRNHVRHTVVSIVAVDVVQ
nr:hypothetical protein [Halomicrobium sp. IBSBa]